MAKKTENRTNEVKTLRLGGEYELKNVNTSNSQNKARELFLRLIGEKRPNVASNLLRIINFEYLPQPVGQFVGNRYEQYIEKVFEFFILNLFKRSWYEGELDSLQIDPKIRHTPFLFYLDYLFKKQDELNLIKEKIKQESLALYPNSPISEDSARKESIGELIKWSTLKEDNQARDLCDALKKWAGTYNLTDDWCLDFALNVLKNYRQHIIESPAYANFNFNPSEEFVISTVWYSSAYEDIWTRTVQSDTWWDRSPFYITHPNQPRFSFKWREISIEDVWYPESRLGYFREQIEMKFWREVLRKMPYDAAFVDQSKEFLKELFNLDKEIEDYLKKSKKFNDELSKSTRKADQKYIMVKIRPKDTGRRDFHWLIDFQIPLSEGTETLSGADIAIKNRLNGYDARKTVDDAVNRLCKLLCLTKNTQKRGTRKNSFKV